MNEDKDQPLDFQPAKKINIVSFITNEAFSYFLLICFRTIPVYILWNYGMAIELKLPTVSLAFAFCASWLSIILFSTKEIKTLALKVHTLNNQTEAIHTLMTNYLISQIFSTRIMNMLDPIPSPKTKTTESNVDNPNHNE